MAHGLLVFQPGIELVPPALEVQSPNHWTPGDVPSLCLLLCSKWKLYVGVYSGPQLFFLIEVRLIYNII